jgi:hypothetical protein
VTVIEFLLSTAIIPSTPRRIAQPSRSQPGNQYYENTDDMPEGFSRDSNAPRSDQDQS